MRLVGQTDQIEHIRHALLDGLALGADGAHGKCDVLVNGFGVDQAEILIDNAQCTAQIRNLPLFHSADIVVVDDNAAFARPNLTGQQLDDRGFTRAGRTDQKDKFSLVYTQTRLVHRPGPVFVNHGGFTHSYHRQSSSVPTQKACECPGLGIFAFQQTKKTKV